MNRRTMRPAILWVILCTAIIGWTSCYSQETGLGSDGEISPDLLNLKIESAQASTTLDEETVQLLVDLYRRSLANLESTRSEQSRADELMAAASAAPDHVVQLQADIDKLQAEIDTPGGNISEKISLNDLEQSLLEAKASLSRQESELEELRNLYTNEVAVPKDTRSRLATARTERDKALADAKAPESLNQAAEVTEARQWLHLTQASRLTAEIHNLEQELLTHESQLEILSLKQQLTELQVEETRGRAGLLEDAISKRREAEAAQALKDAVSDRQELVNEHSEIAQMAAENVELGDRLTQRNLDISSASDERDQAQKQLSLLADELNSISNKLAIAGLNQTLGQLLIEQRRSLPNLRTLSRETKEREKLVSQVGLEQIEFTERHRKLRLAERDIRELVSTFTDEEVAELGPKLKTLVRTQSELLEKSIGSGASYLRVLGELDLAQRQLTSVVGEYRGFLDRTLLWVRTTAPVDIQDLLTAHRQLLSLLSAESWIGMARDMVKALNTQPGFVVLLMGLLILSFYRPRLVRKIDDCAKNIGRVSKDRYSDTILAIILTLVVAATLPMLIASIGYALVSPEQVSVYSASIGSALITTSAPLGIILFFYVGCRENGLLIKHCGWSEKATLKLRQELRWYMWVFPIARIIAVASSQYHGDHTHGGLTIIASATAAGSFAVLMFRLFTPAGGVLAARLAQDRNSVLSRALPLWLLVLAFALPALLLMWLAGYSYTAEVLASSYIYSFWLVLFLKVLNDLLVRWVTLGSQRLQLRAALERRDQARAERAERARETRDEKLAANEESDYEVEVRQVDFAELDSDSRFLIRMAVMFSGVFWLWLIWSPVIPALGVLDDVVLWTKSAVVDGQGAHVPVTLMNVFLAVLVAIVTVVLTRGLPSLVELVLLHSTNLTAGGRYTANTLLRYAIIGIGSIIVISMLGVSWSKAQWLVAALGVGIGFGLQEIVANFISGLVILFERPIRVGDVVTVGETSGVVTRIQIRATTIRDYDRKELLVPNKEFITSRLLNWSLSDEITRHIIDVGIAYGSDVALAKSLAEEAAREHPNVMDDPAPFVIFKSFGDNALNLSLRVYMPSMEHRLTTVSSINSAINQKFTDAGIVIAFPQRDIHLDTSKPLDIRVHPSPEDE